MDEPEQHDEFLPLPDMLENLARIRDKLIEINERSGYVANYVAIRTEISEIGWGGVLLKYHPDINIDDPAAYPLFELYKYVYSTMNKP